MTEIKYSFYGPVEYSVLVKHVEVEEKSEGGIILCTESMKEKEQMAQTRAHLIAVGGNAFKDFDGERPEVGDEVIIEKYAGYTVEDSQTKEKFKVCTDKTISLIVKKNAVKVTKVEAENV